MPKKTLRSLLFIGIGLIGYFPLFSQKVYFTLSGKIIDAETQRPLPDASLVFDGGFKGAATDSLGNYSMKVPQGEWGVRVTYLGYKLARKKIKIDRNTIQNFALESLNSTFDEMVVSGTAQKITENTAIGLNMLSIKGVKKLPTAMGEVDILRSLQTLPGISSIGEGANGVNIRGGTVDQNLIYVDETPIFNPTHMFGLFSVFPADAIRSIELYKGSVPAQFGGRTSSVMDIKMLEPNTENFKINGGIGIVSERLMMEIPLIKGKLSFLTAGRVSYNDYLLRWFGNSSIAGTTASFYDVANKLFYKPNSKTAISLSSYINRDNYGVDSLFSIQNILARKTNFKYGHQNFSLKISHYFNEKFSLNLVGVMSKYATATFSDDIASKFELDTKLLYKNIKLNVEYNASEHHKMNFGISAIRYDISPGSLNNNIVSIVSPVEILKEQSYELGAFWSDNFQISKRWSAEYGFRFVEFLNVGPDSIRTYAANEARTSGSLLSSSYMASGIESSYSGFEPRVSFKYSLGKDDAIKFGYNRMNQFIQLVSNNTTPLPTSRWKTSDRYIKPQQSDFFTIGYFKTFSDDLWEFSSDLYYKRTNNLLDYISGADLQLNRRIETQLIQGKGKAYGLELMLTKKKGETTGWIAYTYARAFEQMASNYQSEQLNDGKWFRTDYDKPNTVNIVVNSQVGIHHSFSWNWVYSTGRPFTAPVGTFKEGNIQFPIYSERNNDRISDYHRLDFSWTIINATMHEHRWEGSWVFTVYNLYGRHNAYSYFFKPSLGGLVANQLTVFSVPIISLAYNFKFK